MEETSLKDIAVAVGGRLAGLPPVKPCTGAAVDSRAVLAGDLFVPIAGTRTDGHRFIVAALQNGASGFLFESCRAATPEVAKALLTATGIGVKNTLAALQTLAGWNRSRLGTWIAAVTGSNGKTTTKEMIGSVFNRQVSTYVSLGNMNNDIGLPLNLLRIGPEHRAAVLEMGMNHPGEISRLCELARPHTGLITNVGPAHLEFMGTLKNVALAKGELLDGLSDGGTAVLNIDDPWVRRIGEGFKGKTVWYGFSRDAAVRAEKVHMSGGGSTFNLIVPGTNGYTVTLGVPGEHNIMNALAVAALAWLKEIDPDHVAAAMAAFTPVHGRLEVLEGAGWIVVNDCYNANPASLAAGLKAAENLNGKRLVVVLSDMLELGEASDSLHRKCGRLVAASHASLLFVWGDYADSYCEGALEGGLPADGVVMCMNKDELARRVRETVTDGDVVLVKASRSRSLDMVTERLL